MQHYHAIVWMDHREARVFFVDRNSAEKLDLATAGVHLHHKAGSISGKRTKDDDHFLHSVVDAIKPAQEWLVIGPGSAKLEFVKHVHRHDPQLSDRILGVETADHPSDKQIVAHARVYFKHADSMLTET